ncbi:MAG: hypothetical protein WCX64_02040 [Candidatus Micrarchaeia archaeon]
MATGIAGYSPEITDQSKDELVSIAHWLGKNKRTAYLVGGWAVYHYTKDFHGSGQGEGIAPEDGRESFNPLGSKDIDLVFPNAEGKQSFEFHYCKEGGYKKRGIYPDKPWTKTVPGAVPTDIIIDLDVLSREWKERGMNITWKHLVRHNAEMILDDKVVITVPEKELLLLYKCVAIISRTDQSRQPKANVSYLTSKIWKDAFDILALWDTGIDKKKLVCLVAGTKLEQAVKMARQIVESRLPEFAITRYGQDSDYLVIGDSTGRTTK